MCGDVRSRNLRFPSSRKRVETLKDACALSLPMKFLVCQSSMSTFGFLPFDRR